jgi:hypothetical protein
LLLAETPDFENPFVFGDGSPILQIVAVGLVGRREPADRRARAATDRSTVTHGVIIPETVSSTDRRRRRRGGRLASEPLRESIELLLEAIELSIHVFPENSATMIAMMMSVPQPS